MSPAVITSAPVAVRQRRNRLLTVTLGAVLAVGAAIFASPGLEEPNRPAGPVAWPAGPIEFDDPAVVKGARGGRRSTVPFPLFGDPTVRKGAGAQRWTPAPAERIPRRMLRRIGSR